MNRRGFLGAAVALLGLRQAATAQRPVIESRRHSRQVLAHRFTFDALYRHRFPADTLRLFPYRLAPGSEILNAHLQLDEIDTNAVPSLAVTLELVDDKGTVPLIPSSIVGQYGGHDEMELIPRRPVAANASINLRIVTPAATYRGGEGLVVVELAPP